MNGLLLRNFTVEEVRDALFEMHPAKAPGPDRMSAIFYQHYWPIVGNDVTNAILSFLHGSSMERKTNYTHIVLIPKVKQPEQMSDYRPISLCNVVYKIISKVLANRLKQILPEIISENQSAFVPGRLISDNILIAFEAMHVLKNKRCGREGVMALKLDMSKAYDRVEWSFLKGMMLTLGFDSKWVELIMGCVSTVSYSIVINGDPKGCINPTRGLRQGDALSPYLFLLCAEGLSYLLWAAIRDGSIHGFRISRGSPSISHLFFADVSLLFLRASTGECQALLTILRIYEETSGQKINVEKSALFFSSNTNEHIRRQIRGCFGVQSDNLHGKYLGLPTVIGRSKKEVFSNLKERVWRKLQGWKEKLLSKAGREVLIKAVAQSIPTYTMSCFRLPVSVCDELVAMMSRFWWGQKDNERRIHWVAWGKMCEAKSCGGLGFRDLRAFNLALLAKQGWRLIQNESSLLFKIYKAKYFPNGSFLEAGLGNNPSYAWRSIVEAREVLKKGIRWRVGDGSKIKIWKDDWLPSSSSSKVSSSPSGPLREATVDMLIDPINGWWRSNLIRHLFTVEEADLILSIPLSKRAHVDKVYWPDNSTGHFSVKSAYYVARAWLKDCSPQIEQLETFDASDYILWRAIWACKVPNKVKVFAWRACQNALPSRDSLAKRGVLVQHDCPVCQDHEESVLHVLWDCVWAKQVWAASPLVANLNSGSYPNTKEWLKGFISHHGVSDLDLVLVTAWRIWYNRNCVLYEGKNAAAPDVCPAAANYLTEFKEANRAMTGSSSQGNHQCWGN